MEHEKGGELKTSDNKKRQNILYFLAIIFLILVLVELAYLIKINKSEPARNMTNAFIDAEKDKEECLNFFNRIKEVYENDFETDYPIIGDYVLCESIKSKDINQCEKLKNLKNDYRQLYEKCRQGVGDYLYNILPMLETGECAQEGEYYNDGFYEICRVFNGDNIDMCDGIQDDILKQGCIALSKDSVAECETLPEEPVEEDKFGEDGIEETIGICKDIFYMLKALKDNNKDYINYIESQDTVFYVELYYDNNNDCREMIEKKLPERCEEYFYFLKENCDDKCPLEDPN